MSEESLGQVEDPAVRGHGVAPIALLPALPVLSAPTARGAIGVSQQQTLAALKAPAHAGVLRQISDGTYNRQFAAMELFELLTAYEARVVGSERRG